MPLILALYMLLSSSAFSSENLNKIFDPEMIGANLAYLEKITGPARNTYNHREKVKTNIYKIDDCEVTADISDEKIDALGIEKLSSKCTFNLKSFLPNLDHQKLPPLYDMTFGQFDTITGNVKYTAGCLMDCGNLADPVVYGNWEGSHADLFFELQLTGPGGGGEWTDAMVKGEGEDWVREGKYNCSDKYNDMARKQNKDTKITSAIIGFGLAGRGLAGNDRDCIQTESFK